MFTNADLDAKAVQLLSFTASYIFPTIILINFCCPSSNFSNYDGFDNFL